LLSLRDGKWCAFPGNEREADALWAAVARQLSSRRFALTAAERLEFRVRGLWWRVEG